MSDLKIFTTNIEQKALDQIHTIHPIYNFKASE